MCTLRVTTRETSRSTIRDWLFRLDCDVRFENGVVKGFTGLQHIKRRAADARDS